MKFIEKINKYKLRIVLIIFLFIILTIILGLIFLPNLFYDEWIWRYYWGPVVADADPNSSIAIYNGIQAKEGYTIVSEITYGIILIISIYIIYNLLKKLQITIDWRFCLALIPYIIYGPITRVLEDTGYFKLPIAYWFISPLIYLQVTAYVLFFLFIGYLIEKKYNNPYLTIKKIILFGGVILLLPFLYLITQWIIGNQWSYTNGIRLDFFALVLTIVSAITIILYLVSKRYDKNEKISVYKTPLNLAMLFGHMLDGLTSYISIYDPFNMALPSYIEKHPASNFLMETWPPLFPIIKFILIILVIYVFDILYKDELKDHKYLVGLLKICIFILGFSPGVRDLLRVTMGV